MVIFIIIAVLFIIMIIKVFRGALPFVEQVINCFTGSNGSGKTYFATFKIIAKFNVAKLLHKLKLMKAEPRIYSNIPLFVDNKTDVYVLKREHLLLQETFPENVCPFTLVDELSMIASCYGWDDPNFSSRNLNENMETLDTFIRFYRHFYGVNNGDRCRLFLTDQATGGVNIQIRRRLGYVYYLYGFHRLYHCLPFCKVNVKQMVVEEDSVNQNNVDIQEKDKNYFICRLPYRWTQKLFKKKRRYDTHCFSEVLKTHKFVSKLPFDIWPKDKLTTNYCPDLRMTDDEKKRYKQIVKGLDVSVATTNLIKPY